MTVFLQRDPTTRLLKTFLPPFKGTWKTLPSYLLPDDTLQDSLNVTLQAGRLRARAGLKVFDSADLGNPVVGSFLTVDTTSTKYPLCSTKNKVFRFIGFWDEITGTVTLNGTSTTQVRMSSLQLGTQVYVIYANGVDELKIIPQQTYTLQAITPFAGTIPVCTDICTSFSRFVGITPPYTVQWCDVINSNYLSFTNWPALNQVILADTEDPLVAIRSLGTLGIAVYKEGNIFVGFAQSGPNAAAFRFEHRGEYEGPAGVNAIVNVNGAHVYMTPTGRIGVFDGTNQQFIADGLWPFLQDDIETMFAKSIFGVYNYKTAEVTFWYPRKGEAGALKGMVVIPLPYPSAGIVDFAYFLGRSNFSCTNGLSVRLFNATASPFVFGNVNETFTIDRDTVSDRGVAFPCSLTTPLYRPPEEQTGGMFRPILSVYASRDSSRGVIQVSAMVSDLLENDGNATTPQTVDLTSEVVSEYLGFNDGSNFNDTGSLLGAKITWDSTAKFEYKGLEIYGKGIH